MKPKKPMFKNNKQKNGNGYWGCCQGKDAICFVMRFAGWQGERWPSHEPFTSPWVFKGFSSFEEHIFAPFYDPFGGHSWVSSAPCSADHCQLTKWGKPCHIVCFHAGCNHHHEHNDRYPCSVFAPKANTWQQCKFLEKCVTTTTLGTVFQSQQERQHTFLFDFFRASLCPYCHLCKAPTMFWPSIMFVTSFRATRRRELVSLQVHACGFLGNFLRIFRWCGQQLPSSLEQDDFRLQNCRVYRPTVPWTELSPSRFREHSKEPTLHNPNYRDIWKQILTVSSSHSKLKLCFEQNTWLEFFQLDLQFRQPIPCSCQTSPRLSSHHLINLRQCLRNHVQLSLSSLRKCLKTRSNKESFTSQIENENSDRSKKMSCNEPHPSRQLVAAVRHSPPVERRQDTQSSFDKVVLTIPSIAVLLRLMSARRATTKRGWTLKTWKQSHNILSLVVGDCSRDPHLLWMTWHLSKSSFCIFDGQKQKKNKKKRKDILLKRTRTSDTFDTIAPQRVPKRTLLWFVTLQTPHRHLCSWKRELCDSDFVDRFIPQFCFYIFWNSFPNFTKSLFCFFLFLVLLPFFLGVIVKISKLLQRGAGGKVWRHNWLQCNEIKVGVAVEQCLFKWDCSITTKQILW